MAETLLEIENAVLRIVARHESVLEPKVFEEVLAVLRAFAPVALGIIGIADGNSAFRALVQSHGMSRAIPYRTRHEATPEMVGTLMEKGQPIFVSDLSAGTPVDSLADELGVRSYVAVPIFPSGGGKPFASLSLSFAEEGKERSVPLEVLTTVASVIAGSVERGLEKAQDRRAARILDASGDAMVAWDSDGHIIDVNAAASTLADRPREELLGLSIEALFGAVPEGPSSALRLSLVRPDGTTVRVSATVSPVQGDPLVMAHALLRDLSDVVAAELEASKRLAQLRELTEQHILLLDNAPLLIFRIDPATDRLLYLNRHAERLFGVSAQDALSTPGFLRDLHVDPDGRLAFEDALSVAKLGDVSAPYEARLGRLGRDPDADTSHGGDDHEPIIARGTIYPILAGSGRVAGIEGILLDVTGERAARSRLVQADRLATVGMLAAGVAHEINNPAAFILLGLDALSRQLAGPRVTMEPPAKEIVGQLVEDLRETGRRIVDIARDMRLFASPPGAEIGRPTVVDVSRTIESALTITRAQIVEKADVELELANDLPPVAMDDGRLGQVLVNLLVNAAQAIGEARMTRTVPIKGDRVRIATRAEGPDVVVEVEDTGTGMSPRVMNRVFTPFFTTKGPDAGTGLGLAISKTIIERAGGTIVASSPSALTDPPRGSRFVIRLPAFLDEIVHSVRPDRHLLRERASVLVVEDEVLLGKALAEQIGEVHDVKVATGGEEALELLNGSRFDAVLCDLKMPGMSGEALYRHVERANPEQARRFLFMTGVGFGADIERFVHEANATMLEKPFPIERALSAIANVIVRSTA